MFRAWLVFLCLTVLVICGCRIKVNGDIRIREGKQASGSLMTINGNIRVGPGGRVTGSCRSVNGRIYVMENAIVRSLQSVNGDIDLESNVDVQGDVESVNGGINARNGVMVNGDINTVNGSIRVNGTEVRRDVTSYNGDIQLSERSVVHGDIIIRDSKGESNRTRPLRIRIDGMSVVEGNVIVKNEDLRVELILAGESQVRGRIRDAEVIMDEE